MKVIIEIEPYTIEIVAEEGQDLDDLVWEVVKDRVEYTYTVRDEDA